MVPIDLLIFFFRDFQLQRDQQHQGLLLPQKMIEEQKKRMSEIAKMKDEQKTVEKRIELKQKEMEAVWKNEQKRLIQQDVEKTKHFKTFLHKMQLNDQGEWNFGCLIRAHLTLSLL